MRYAILSLCAIVLSALVLAACNSTAKPTDSKQAPAQAQPQTETVHADGVKRITIADANTLIKNGQAYVLDVRNQAAYDAGHIPGAKLIPLNELLNHVNEFPRDKTIITYCSCPAEQTSVAAGVSLKSKNIDNVAALLGGFIEWQKQGLPVQTKQ